MTVIGTGIMTGDRILYGWNAAFDLFFWHQDGGYWVRMADEVPRGFKVNG